MDSKQKFLDRMFVFNLQDIIAFFMSIAIWCIIGWTIIPKIYDENTQPFYVFLAPPLLYAMYNTITYFWSSWMVKKYGIDMFADLDQEWLREHQAFDSKAFGEIFSRSIQCKKIAGLYLLAVIIPVAVFHMGVAAFVGAMYIVVFWVYKTHVSQYRAVLQSPKSFWWRRSRNLQNNRSKF